MGKNVKLVSVDNGETFEEVEKVGFMTRVGRKLKQHKKAAAIGAFAATVLIGTALTLLNRKGSRYEELEADLDENDLIEEDYDEEDIEEDD